MKAVTEVVARPARTIVQGTPAWVITELLDSYGIVPMDERQYGVTVLALTALIGAVQTAAENHWGRALLRAVPARRPPLLDRD